MIPLGCKESVEFTDTDGTTFKFLPKTGRLERELLELFAKSETASPIEQRKAYDGFLEKILIGWRGPGMPAYSKENVGDLFSMQQKSRILNDMWDKAGDVSVEEKKS